MNEIQQRLDNEHGVNYSYGPYNKVKGDEQWIRLTEGCPHNCPYCYEPQKNKVFEIPEIVRNKVGIMDMNLLCKPEALQIVKELGEKKVNGKVIYYDLLCGADYRFISRYMAELLKESLRLKKIRIAWDWWYKDQYDIRDACKLLELVGFRKEQIMVFLICNWKIPYTECKKKLDLLKVWNYQVADCYYDNQTGPKFHPVYWQLEDIKKFRKLCRKHNQLVNFKIDPEVIK